MAPSLVFRDQRVKLVPNILKKVAFGEMLRKYNLWHHFLSRLEISEIDKYRSFSEKLNKVRS